MKSINVIAMLSSLLLMACAQKNEGKQAESVNTAVHNMAANIAKDISGKGPMAWLDYFEQTPNFFMANEGQRVFMNYDSAAHFIKEVLVKENFRAKLTWSNIYVDSLTPSLAILSANYHEDIFLADENNTVPQNGYFTGTAEKTTGGWKLRNLHWSSLKK